MRLTGGLRADFVVCGEPTDMRVGIQAKGVLAMKPIPKLMWMPYGKHSEKMMLGFAKLLNADSLGKRLQGLDLHDAA